MKRIISALLILALLSSGLQGIRVLAEGKEQEQEDNGKGYEVSFTVDQTWNEGYQATVSIRNTGKERMENWCLSFAMSDNITNIWNGVMLASTDGHYTVKNAEWNQDIPVGSTVSFGFTAEGSQKSMPSEFALQTTRCLVDDKQYQVAYSVQNDWSDGFTASVTITNVSSVRIEDWRLEFSLGHKISQIWNGEILKDQGGQYVIGNEGYNANILPQQSVTFGFLCERGDSGIVPNQFILHHYKAVGMPVETTNPATEEPDKGDSGKEDSGSENLDTDEYDETYRSESLTEDNAGECVHIEFQPGNTERCVTDDITLVNDAEERYQVQWISSDEEVISHTGKVSRPENDRSIVMTAIIKGNGESVKLSFSLEVRGKITINVSDIEDYSLEDLEERNRDNEDYEALVNDFGYLQEVYGNYSDFKVNSYESALYALYHVKSAIGITNPFAELVPYRTFVDDTGYTFQFAQTIQGIPTFDNIITVASNAKGETDYLKSSYYPVEVIISTIPQISCEEAEAILEEKYGTISVREENKTKICIVNYYGHVDLAWNICCQVDSKQEDVPSGPYRFLVGAVDGEIKFHSELSSHSTTVKRVKASGKDLEGIEQIFYVQKEIKKMLFSTKSTYSLRDPLFHITVTEGELRKNTEDKIDEVREVITKGKNSWKPVEVSAIYNMKKILTFYYKNFNRVSYANNNHIEKKYTYRYKTKLGQGGESRVCLVEDLKNNSYWDGEYHGIRIGVGDGKQLVCVGKNGKIERPTPNTELKKNSYALCRDILCHEYTHGIMVNDTNLDGYAGIPGSINEAYADIAACFMDGNWTVGEKIGMKQPVRDISNPNCCYTASEVEGDYYVDPTDYKVNRGGKHSNSTVISHAVYLMVQKGIAMSDLQDIWYNTIRGGLDSKTNFYSVRKLFLTSCKRQKYSDTKKKSYERIIKQAFDTTNVTKSSSNHRYKQYTKLQDQNYYCNGYFRNNMIFQGKVVEADGDVIVGNNKILSGVRVSIQDLEGREIGKQITTDSKGRYQLDSRLGHAYAITFQKEGYQEEIMYLSDINELLQQEYYCDTVELVPQKGFRSGGAVGTIYNASNKRSISGLQLLIRKGINNIYTKVYDRLETDQYGEYYFSSIEAGNYCVEVVGTEKYESTFFNIKVERGKVLGLQDGYISSVLDHRQMRTVLTWSDAPEDLDAHMLCKLSNGRKEDVNYNNKEFNLQDKKISALDIDVTNGFGPETVTLYYGKTGWYHYFVHQYSSDGGLESSNASVRVYLPGKAHPSYTFHAPVGQGKYWDVFRYNSATQRMVPINQIKNKIE